jgi:hypothetical protein
MERWAIHIDIEGFSVTYEKSAQGLFSLRALMEGIYLIGKKWCPYPPERMFAHQLGDGFIIIGEFRRDSLDVPISIAIALMRQVLFSDGAAKAVIVEGELADIQGCFPKRIRDESEGDSWVRLARGGLMTTFPVMGNALIRAINLAKDSPSGSLLLIEEAYRSRIPEEIHLEPTGVADLLSIDWIHAKPKSLELIQQEIVELPQLSFPPNVLEFKLKEYIKNNDLKGEWKDNTLGFLQIK